MDCDTQCELILQWSETLGPHSPFNPDKVESIQAWGREHDFTPAQEAAIDNIYRKWKVGAWAKKAKLI